MKRKKKSNKKYNAKKDDLFDCDCGFQCKFTTEHLLKYSHRNSFVFQIT